MPGKPNMDDPHRETRALRFLAEVLIVLSIGAIGGGIVGFLLGVLKFAIEVRL